MTNSVPTTSFVYPSLLREWKDFTDAHRRAREIAEEALNKFSNALKGITEESPPLIIAGGLGSGKTQLLYHLFKYSWKNLRIPALYANLREILSLIKRNMMVKRSSEKLKPRDFVSNVMHLALKKLEFIKEGFEGGFKLGELWLPEVTGQQANMPPSELFKKIGIAPNEAYNLIKNVLEHKQGIVLLIDEVEMAYEDLKGIIEGGFRDLVDIIGRNVFGLYITLAVSYLSYYELFLSEFTGDVAFARRIRIAPLPPIHPDVLYEELKVRNMEDKSNTFWWFTRGRLGWVTALKDVIMLDDKSVNSLLRWDSAPQLRSLIAENLPVFDIDELHKLEDEYCRGNDECIAALRYFVLNIRPHKIEDLPRFVMNHLDDLGALLTYCGELVRLTDAVERFTSDIKDFCDREGIRLSDRGIEVIKRGLNEILSSLALRAGGEKLLCLGAKDFYLVDDRVRDYVDSIIDILMTYIAENYGNSEEVKSVNEALYLVHSMGLSKGKLKDPMTFRRIRELFQSRVGKNYVIVGPWVIRKLIPMYLSNPIISKDPGMSVEKLERILSGYLLSYPEHRITDAIKGVSEYIMPEKEDLVTYIVPLPRGYYINSQIKDKAYELVKSIIQNYSDEIKYSSLHIAIFFAGGDMNTIQDIRNRLTNESSLFDLLINKTKRISLKRIPGERLSDFVKSLFVLFVSENATTMESVITELRPDQRRRVDYFKNTIVKWIEDSIKALKRERESLMTISQLQDLIEILKEDVKVLEHALDRAARFRPHIKAHAAFFTVFNTRDPFEAMSLSLSPGGLIKVKALPSIYQDLRKDTCQSIDRLLRVPLIHSIVRVAVEERKDLPLNDALKILEDDQLPLFNDFCEIIENSVDIRRGEYSPTIKLLYRILLLYTLIILRKNEIATFLLQNTPNIKEACQRLKDLLEDLKKTSDDICKGSPLCIKISIGSKNMHHTLEDEVEGVLSALETVENWAKALNSNEEVDIDKILSLAYMALFGLPDENDLLLSQIRDIITNWYDGLHDRVYSKLLSLQQALRQLPIMIGNAREPINIEINSLRDLDRAEHTISEVLNEVESVVKDYNKFLEKTKGVMRRLQTTLKKALDKINSLNLEV